MSKAGDWEITHWRGGYPVWVQIKYKGEEIAQGVHHGELRDLHHAIGRAILECRDALPANYKHEMD